MGRYLLIYDHPELGEQRFELKAGRTYRLGSRSGNDIVIPQKDVSRNHAVLRADHGRFHVTDLNSKNGTFVNGVSVNSAELRPGDEIMLSSARLTIVEVSSGTFALAPEIRPTAPAAEQGTGSEGTAHFRAVADIEDMVALLEMSAACAERVSVADLLRWVVEKFHFTAAAVVHSGGRGGLSLVAASGDLDLGSIGAGLAGADEALAAAGGETVRETSVAGRPLLVARVNREHELLLRCGEERPATGDICAVAAAVRIVLNALGRGRPQRPGGPHRPGTGGAAALDAILGSSAAITGCKQLAERFAAQEEPVLITGESGTGKELFARAIHELSPRSGGPFVAVNCAAIPAELIEAELFGVAPGAATGVQPRRGRFQAAEGGTLLLDEVGDLPLPLQGKLLRVLEQGELYRVGEDTPIRCDVRIVSATNRDLKAEVDAGRFRADLYYRLHVLRIHVPPLRERRPDIPVLVSAFLEEAATRMHKPINGVTVRALERLQGHDWPGNVRELKSEIIRAVAAVTPGAIIDVRHLSLGGEADPQGHPTAGVDPAVFAGMSLAEARDVFERRLIEACLAECGGNRTAAAARLGLSRAGLFKKMRRLGL